MGAPVRQPERTIQLMTPLIPLAAGIYIGGGVVLIVLIILVIVLFFR
jgi:hypothetical protein